MGLPWNNGNNFIFPTKYVIPKSLSRLARTAESDWSFFGPANLRTKCRNFTQSLEFQPADLGGVFLPETNSSPLKMDGWNTTFLLGRPIFRGYVSFREGKTQWWEFRHISWQNCSVPNAKDAKGLTFSRLHLKPYDQLKRSKVLFGNI